MQLLLSTMKIICYPKALFTISRNNELRIDNYDKSNLHTFEEQICRQGSTSDDDIKAKQEELLQQENFKKMLKYNPIEKGLISRLPVENQAPLKEGNYKSADLCNQQYYKFIPKEAR